MAETTITEQIVREAPEIEALKLGLVQSAKDLADAPIQLPEQQIAGLSGLQQRAATAAEQAGGIGGYQPFLTSGSGTIGTGLSTLGTALGTLGQAQTPITAAQQAISGSSQLFAPTDLSAYTNPYQQQVIDTTIAEMNRQAEISRNNLAAQGVGAGAFGGSRFGIAGTELDRNLADSQARALAQLNAQNYNQALGASQTAFENQQRRQQAQSQLYGGIAGLYGNLGGQQAGIAGQQAGIGGQQLGLGQLSQQLGLQDISTMQQLGREQQAQQQAELDALRANQQKQLYEPYSRVAFLSDIYKGAPSTSQSLGSQVSPSAPTPSAFQQVAGIGTGLLGTAAAAKQIGGLF
jgi:hypothetical protein|tara:strand:- start:403 stop:1449 length:1047 start_codon:yes stop_codon:yes gene_type:complete